MTNKPGTNSGHGHVWARPDGMVARCTGTRHCKECQADAAALLEKAITPPCPPMLVPELGVRSFTHCGQAMRLQPRMLDTLYFIATGANGSRSSRAVCDRFNITAETYRVRMSTIRKELGATRQPKIGGYTLVCKNNRVTLEEVEL